MNTVIISIYSRDIFLESNEIKKGGPARFIKFVFDKNFVEYELISAEKEAVVEIKKFQGEERGKINQSYNIPLREISKNCNILISTILKDVDLDKIPKVEGLSAIDIQGFVRDDKSFGNKLKFDFKNYSKFDIVKGTEEEIAQIDANIIKKIPIVLVTNGSKEGYVMERGEKIEKIVPRKILCVNDTIGAGDTFLASFFIKFLETKNIKKSLDFSTKEVYDYLVNKNE